MSGQPKKLELYYLIAVLLLPLLVLWRQDNVLFTPIWSIDPWLYFGYFNNLVEFKRQFALSPTYYGSRLSWLVPGAVAHSIFSPVAASYVLHLAVHSAAAVSLFAILRLAFGVRTAFLGALFFSLHPWLWRATGWDYPDGAGIAYCLIAMALMTGAARRDRPQWMLFLAGVAIAAMVYSHLIPAPFAPAVAATYLVLAPLWKRVPVRTGAIELAIWTGAGAAALTAAFGAFNYWLEGRFWFYAPSLRMAAGLIQDNSAFVGIWTPEGLLPHLWVPFAATLVAIAMSVVCWRKRHQEGNAVRILFSGQLLYAMGVLSYLQFFRQNPGLAFSYYASFLMPFVFLVLAAAFWSPAERLSERGFTALALLSAAALAVMWADPLGRTLPAFPMMPIAALLAAIAIGVVWLFFRVRSAGPAAGCALALLLVGYSRPQYSDDQHRVRREFERVIDLRAEVEKERQGQPVVFWYDRKEAAGYEYNSLTSTYVQSVPSTPFPAACPPDHIDLGSLVVVLSHRDRPGQAASEQLRQCWWNRVTVANPVRTVKTPGYTMALLRVEEDASRLRPLEASFFSADQGRLTPTPDPRKPPPLPPARWRVTGEGLDTASIAEGVGGYVVQTSKQAGLQCLRYPDLAVVAGGLYRFRLKYRPIGGSFTLGALDPRNNAWYDVAALGQKSGDGYEMIIPVRLNEGQSVRFVLMNNRDGVPSRFLLQELTAFRVE